MAGSSKPAATVKASSLEASGRNGESRTERSGCDCAEGELQEEEALGASESAREMAKSSGRSRESRAGRQSGRDCAVGELEAEEERKALCASQSVREIAKSSGPERPRLRQRSRTSPPPSPLPPMRKLVRSREQAAELASDGAPEADAEEARGGDGKVQKSEASYPMFFDALRRSSLARRLDEPPDGDDDDDDAVSCDCGPISGVGSWMLPCRTCEKGC